MPSQIKSLGSQMPVKLKLKLANECENLLSKSKIEPDKKDYKYHVVHSRNMNELTYKKIMSLFESLMRTMYENSSWGWNEEEKMGEWKHQRTRILLVTKLSSAPGKNLCTDKLPTDDEPVIAFMCFRFEVGANKNECALYVYELHVDPQHQRQGLGEDLMRIAKVFALDFKMDKIMLTAFRSNQQALQFYSKLKYNTDKSSPMPNEADYIILSIKPKI